MTPDHKDWSLLKTLVSVAGSAGLTMPNFDIRGLLAFISGGKEPLHSELNRRFLGKTAEGCLLAFDRESTMFASKLILIDLLAEEKRA